MYVCYVYFNKDQSIHQNVAEQHRPTVACLWYVSLASSTLTTWRPEQLKNASKIIFVTCHCRLKRKHANCLRLPRKLIL